MKVNTFALVTLTALASLLIEGGQVMDGSKYVCPCDYMSPL